MREWGLMGKQVSQDDSAGVMQATSGGTVGAHSDEPMTSFLVAPSTDSQFNRVRLGLIPKACWSVEDIRFAFDSSFVDADLSTANIETPQDIRAEFIELSKLLGDHPRCPLSIFGHADPVGSDDYNKALSGRRATAIYALLLFNSDPNGSVALWSRLAREESWGPNQRNVMQQLTGSPAAVSMDQLIGLYMKSLCGDAPPLTKADFLARGADVDGKGDIQGCSEFNPRILFSREKQTQFDQAKSKNDKAFLDERNRQNAPNRRVTVLIFRKGSVVEPSSWPCPTVKEGKAGCEKRLWSDADSRRNTHLPGIDRKFTETKDTFACRFYQRLTINSPCEHVMQRFSVRLYDPSGAFIAGAPYRLEMSENRIRSGVADFEGFIHGYSASLPLTCPLYWGMPSTNSDENPAYTFRLEVCIQPSFDQQDEVDVRLSNLGCSYEQDQQGNLKAFQAQYGQTRGLRQDGVLDEPTLASIREIHDGCDDHLGAQEVAS